MATAPFERARSDEAKRSRERDILAAARRIAAERSVRNVTLTEVADAVGLHKSALLRYFESREQILLLLAAEDWPRWSTAVREELDRLEPGASAASVAAVLTAALVDRPLFCDLLAHVPLGLERNVSVETVRRFKRGTGQEVDAIAASLARLIPSIEPTAAVDAVATATSLAGAFWQMATPPATVAELYRTDPELTHAVVDVGPRLQRILTALLRGSGAP